MTKHIRSLLAMLLAIVMIVGILPTVALARNAEPADEPAVEDLPQANGMQVHTPYGLKLGTGKQATRGQNRDLPTSYNSVKKGYITSVKNQTQYGNYGTCWAFGTMAPIEAYMIKNKMQVGNTGETATTDLDLSEYHLSYFNYTNSYDEHNLTIGDSSILEGESHVDVGGDGYKATLTMMRWIGAASEAESALAYSECSTNSTIDPKYAYAYDVGHVTSVDWIEPTDMDTIKQYIMEYGAGFFGYYYKTAYEGLNGAYCYMNTNESNDYGPNHGVTVVGWDDNYSKSNFTGRSKPTANGAWIIKNSWGNHSHTDGGYNYISYEDTSYLGHPIMFFTVDSLNTYNHLYQYDGTCFTGDATKGWIPLTVNNSLISNVFTAAGKETVEAFSICTLEEDLGFTLQVYKNPTNLTGSNPNPASGTLMSTQTGTIAHAGYHTIRIASPFKVEAGDTFSAVFTLDSKQGGQNFQMVIPCDETQTEDYTENGASLATLIHTHASHPGTSFFRLRDNSTWSQLDNGKSLRIKAYTTDAPFDLTVEAGAHGSAALGTYTAGVGYQVTATPDSGYYASGYTVVSGAANVMQNGNSFYVNPTENTVIRINFSQQEPFTLTYMANGETFGSPVTGMTGDAVALPAGAAAFEGYTFLGWATSEVPDAVTGKPLCLEPGATYYPNGGNTTLYALYSFRALAVPGLDGSYEKITSTADLTEGSYLIVNEASLHALDGSKADSAGMVAKINTAPNYVDVTFNGDRIPENETLRNADFNYDPEAHLFISVHGYPVSAYKDGYYFYVWGSSNSSAAQNVTFDASGNAVMKDATGQYTAKQLCYTAASPAYFSYEKTAAQPVQLYRKTEDTTTTYFSTNVDAAPVTAWTVSFNSNGGSVVANQTVVDGQTAVRPADPTNTGYTFVGWYSDSALTNAYDFTQPVTADLVLYAKWTEAAATYTVTFNSNGGSAVAAQTVTEGETATRPVDPTKTGFTFDGWYSDSALTNVYDFSQPVTANLTLYAKWTEIVVENVTLTYMVNGAVSDTVTVAAGTGVTLPESATAFDGWTFIGWASAATEETAAAPDYYAPGASYTVNANASLYALYTRTEGTGGSAYELVTANLSDWTGSYVITKGNAPTYVMAGLDDDTSYETESNGGAAAFASTGITLEGTQLKNVAQVYSFTVAPIEGTDYFSFQNAEKGSYLLIKNSTLYAGSFNSSNSRWSVSIDSNGVATIRNPYSSYSNCITFAGSSFWGNIFQVMSSASDIYLWKETASGTSYYTTIIGEPAHEHTPAAPVIENEVPATCTEAGSYDSVVYCTECGEEISRETVTVPATGHTPGTAVKENEVAATCTAAGGYDMVVYCTVCNAELSREHTETPATGHSWGEWISNNDGTHTRTCAACGETETHDCEFGNDTVCDVCGYEKKLNFSASLSLDNATGFNYKVAVSEVDALGLDSFHLVVVHTAYDKATNTYNDETVTLEGSKSGSYYSFDFADIPAMALNDKMVAHLEGTKNGETWSSNAIDFNAIDYCYLVTTLTSQPESLRRTCANLILFAESAQINFSYNTANLPTAKWSDVQENLCDRTVPTWTTDYYSEPLEGATVTFGGLMLDVNSRIDLRFVIVPGNLNAEDLIAEIHYEGLKGASKSFTIPGSEWTDYGTQGRKTVTLHEMNAGELQSSVAIVIKDANGNAVSSTLHYSVDNYAGILYNLSSTSSEMKNMMVTMINYSLRAKVYLETK